MASRSIEQNLFSKLSLKVSLLRVDIRFLKKCQQFKVFPNFMNGIRIKLDNSRTKRVVEFAKQKWLKLEIRYLYSKLSRLELELYTLHLKLAKNSDSKEWDEFCRKIYVINGHKKECKISKINKKFEALTKHLNIKETSINVSQPLVRNESSQIFNGDEIDLLSKGLNFSVCNFTNNTIDDLVANIECNITHLKESDKNYVRNACKMKIQDNLNVLKSKNIFSNVRKDWDLIKGLKRKDCYYLKADKGNTVVILDKTEYVNRVNKLLEEGPYEKIRRNPLNKYISFTNDVVKNCSSVILKKDRYKFHVSNPVLPRLYCLPKIHKEGKSMRPIVSGIDSPTHLLAKFLVEEFTGLSQKCGRFSIKNNVEFVDKIKDVKLKSNEIMVSFDVCSLFPSIPVNETMIYLREFLSKNNVESQKVNEFVKLTEICMNQNYFKFNNEFYKQLDGTAMGNSLSPFIAELFMSKFEEDLGNNLKYFPRVWVRYVDDVFAIFDLSVCSVSDFVSQINSKHSSIKFTYEMEKDNCLPFLDVLCIRNKLSIEFDIYRKPTNNNRYILSDSNHCFKHKMAAFNCMINRAIKIPLTSKRFHNEIYYIKNIAKFNGFDPKVVDNILRKQRLRYDRKLSTTLQMEDRKCSYISLPFDNRLTKGLDSIFNIVNRKVAYKSQNKLKNVLGNPKDKIPMLEKSGIYEIGCNGCDKVYLGQTKRKIITRFKEHLAHIKYDRPEKSSVAEHILLNNHDLDLLNVRLVKNVTSKKLLNSYESICINKIKNNVLMNADKGPIPNSSLFSLLKPR